jgi:hypothetical protein
MSREKTPLSALKDALVGKDDFKLFSDQVLMYRLLIPFMFDQRQDRLEKHYPAGVDDLIVDIRNYLLFMLDYPLKTAAKSEEERFSNMHKCIFANISNSYNCDEITMSPYFLEKDKSGKLLNESGIKDMAPNINNTIYNRRPMPKECKKILSDDKDGYGIVINRCFWLLQYYFVYYHKDICIRNSKETSSFSGKYPEYFRLKDTVARNVYSELNRSCCDYSSLLNTTNNIGTVDTHLLSKIIVDVIVEQVKLQRRINLNRIPDELNCRERTHKTVKIQKQYNEYIKHVDGYGLDSYDRLNLLNKYAKSNCYAANELATMYYWGKRFWIRDNNYYDLEQNYEKAIDWFVEAVNLSDPPLQSACWSLAYTLDNIHYSTEREQKTAEEKAKKYLRMAGDYPAAYNAIAKYDFRDAEILYKEQCLRGEDPSESIDLFAEAIQLADRAGAMDWFYGNNQIALFLNKHKDDFELINKLKKRLELNVPLELEAQLKYSSSYNNPWALKHLALFYIRSNKKEEGLRCLEKAMAVNYSAAFYETAQNYYCPGTEKWKALMTKASALSFPRATFELALNEPNGKEKNYLLNLCKEQVLSEKKVDSQLLDELVKTHKE